MGVLIVVGLGGFLTGVMAMGLLILAVGAATDAREQRGKQTQP